MPHLLEVLGPLVLRTGRRLGPRSLAPSVRWAAVALACATGAAWAGQGPLQALLEGRGGGVVRLVAEIANLCGSGTAVAAAGLAALVIGRGLRRNTLVDAALVLCAAGGWCFLLTHAGQLALAQRRPIEGGEMRFFAPGGHGISGHAAATALLILPVRDILLGGARPLTRRLAAAALMAWAVVVGWSRVWMGMHYGWNVLAGLLLGLWTSAAAVAAWEEATGARATTTGASSGET